MKSIGIYPGTFDPIHEGHIAFAQEARTACKLNSLHLIPEQTPRGKIGVSNLNRRSEAIKAALINAPGIAVTTIDCSRFTVSETMPMLERLFGPAEFTLLIGSDVALHLTDWPDGHTLFSRWSLAIGMRRTDQKEAIEAVIRQIEAERGITIKRTYVYTNKSEMSSSRIRSSQS